MPQRCTGAGQPNRQPYVGPKSPIPLSTSISTSTTMKVWATGDPTLYQVSRCCDASDPKNPPHTPDLQLHTQKVLSDTLSNYPNSLIKKTAPMMVLDHDSVQKGTVGAAYGNRIERSKSSEAFVICDLAATNCSADCCVRPVFQITVPL